LMGQLYVAVLRVIREYEIQRTTPAHMIARVVKSLKNQAVNIAELHGREKRQLVARVREQRAQRTAYHFNTSTGSIKKVIVYDSQELRQYKHGSVVLAVQDFSTEEWLAVHHKRLYETEEEALRAAELYWEGKRSKRDCYLDLSPQDIDDFQLNILSIDVMDERDGARPFADYYADPSWDPNAIDNEILCRELLSNLGEKTKEFAEIVLNSAIDELFDAWCEEHGYNTSTMDLNRLGKTICRYLDIDRSELQDEVMSTNESMWSDQQLTSINQYVALSFHDSQLNH
jgi:hypothetical protein